MSRLAFRLQPIPTASGSVVRVDTASGSNTPADLRTLGGNVIDGAIIRSGSNGGHLPVVLGPDGVTTLYQKVLDYQGQVTGSPVTLTGEDDNPSSGATQIPQGPPGLVWRGAYSGATTYATNDAVQYQGGAFIATAGTIGVAPGTPASPAAPWQLLATGPTGPAGAGSVGVISPADVALKAWACDPSVLNPGTRTTLVAGQMNGVLLNVPTDTLTGINFYVGVAGVALTNCYAALIDATTGNRLAVTADISTTLQSTGLKRVAFTSPLAATAGFVYATFLVGAGTTMPQVTKLTNTDTTFINVRGPGAPTSRIRVGQITAAGSLTAIPATNDLSGNQAQNSGMWVGLD